MTTMLLRRNLRRPSKVCAKPEMVVPTAEKAVEITPRMRLRICWKTATMEPMTEVMAPKMEEMREPMESTREGIFAIFRLRDM